MNVATNKLLQANAHLHRRRAMQASQRQLSEPQRIGEIVPDVLKDILAGQRIEDDRRNIFETIKNKLTHSFRGMSWAR